LDRGIILAGGHGTRLQPLTYVINKHLHAVYDKPMIYHPIATLMKCGIRNLLLVTNPEDLELYQRLLGDGSQWGLHISYVAQPKEEGLAEALVLANKFIGNQDFYVALGDNLFYGHYFEKLINTPTSDTDLAHLFCYWVDDAKQYGILHYDETMKRPISLEEKPPLNQRAFAITGLYHYPQDAVSIAQELITRPSKTTIELHDLNHVFLQSDRLMAHKLSTEDVWFDMGSHTTLYQATCFAATMVDQTGLKIDCPEEIAWRMGYINEEQLVALAHRLLPSYYGYYLMSLLT